MQKEKIETLKKEMKTKMNNVENWLSSMADKISRTDALENLKKSKLEMEKKIADLKLKVTEVENYSEEKKTEIHDELDNLRSVLDSKVAEKEEEIDKHKTELTDTLESIDEKLNAEVNDHVREVYSDFRVVANDIQLRLNTLRLNLMDDEKKNRFRQDVESKKEAIKTDMDNIKHKLEDIKEGTKKDFSVIQDGIKNDFKRLEDFVNRFKI